MKPYSTQMYDSKATRYTIGITDKKGQIDQHRNVIRIRPGYQILLNVIPRLITSTKYLDELDRKKRKCKLPHETEGFSFLKEYSRIGCEFECAAQKAVTICKCLPWNYPNDFKKWPMCDMFGGHCFHNIISDDPYYKKCKANCLPNCQETTYALMPSHVAIDVKSTCRAGSFYHEHFRKNFHSYFAFHSYKTLIENNTIPNIPESFGNGSLCMDYVRNYVSFVSVESPSTGVIITNNDRRIFFYDQLGTFGGTLGLFVGVSVISMFEVGILVLSILWQFTKIFDSIEQREAMKHKMSVERLGGCIKVNRIRVIFLSWYL